MQETTCSVRDGSLIPESGRSPGEGNGNPLLGNPMDRGAWWATVHGVRQDLVTKLLLLLHQHDGDGGTYLIRVS